MLDKTKNNIKRMRKDKSGIFGLTAIQQFFVVILGIAILAYVIVIISGLLVNTSASLIQNVVTTTGNETGWINSTGYQLAAFAYTNISGQSSFSIVSATNSSFPSAGEILLSAANYTLNASGYILNASPIQYNVSKIVYTYGYNGPIELGANNIMANTSAGITGFFSSINPVYAILAVLVIILVLVVLVRVVSGGAQGREGAAPQL